MTLKNGWQPPDTKPTDGTPILVWLAEPMLHSHIHAARFLRNSGSTIGVVGAVFHFDAPPIVAWRHQPPGPFDPAGSAADDMLAALEMALAYMLVAHRTIHGIVPSIPDDLLRSQQIDAVRAAIAKAKAELDAPPASTIADLIEALRATIPALTLLGNHIGNKWGGGDGIKAFDRCEIILNAKNALQKLETP